MRRGLFLKTGTLSTMLTLGLALAGCAQPGSTAAAGLPGPSASEDWKSYEVQASAVNPGSSPDTVVIDVLVPGTGPTCARNARAEQFDQANATIFLHVLVDSAGSETFGVCPTEVPAEVTFKAQMAIADTVLVINEQAWRPTDTSYERCPADLGCAPPPQDHCAANWQQAARHGLDIPAHSAVSGEYCDQNWLIMTVDVNAATCGAGGRPDCSAPKNVSRYYFHFDTAWRLRLTTKQGGCTAILAEEPTFPRELCESLGPTA